MIALNFGGYPQECYGYVGVVTKRHMKTERTPFWGEIVKALTYSTLSSCSEGLRVKEGRESWWKFRDETNG